MKIDAAAAILDTTGFTVRRLCRSGELKAVKVGQQWRVNRAALMAYAGLN
jgi:excisionase family DNA binding protein